MIISKTPYRISFFGGGSDYPSWYIRNGGIVLSTTIDKYIYISCRYLPPFFEHKYRIVWSQMENVKAINEIKHRAVKEMLKYFKIKSGLEIHYDGDLPATSGMGSSSDSRIMHDAAEILDEFGVSHEDQIISAHRTPTRLEEYAKHAEKNGLKVIIAGAGGAAHLPGMIASHTVLPVIGVPILVYNDKQKKKSAFGGLDSLLSISEMPSGSPVVTVGVNKALNAGIYALKILANESSSIRKMLKSHKEKQHKSVLKESQDLKRMGLKKFVKKKFK